MGHTEGGGVPIGVASLQEMFYQFAKPLKIYRPRIPMPYRTAEECAKVDEVFAVFLGGFLQYLLIH
jgi:hypothetical protein